MSDPQRRSTGPTSDGPAGDSPSAEQRNDGGAAGSKPFSIEGVTVRPLRERDLAAVAPMLTLATASGLTTPPPVIAPGVELGVEPDGGSREPDPGDAPEHDEYWLADHDGRILGFALLHHVDRNRASIRAIWVDERHRRRGVGRRLLEGTVVHCQRAGYLKLVLELPFALEEMVPLFGRLGFGFARRRAINGNTILEFYLDLYREPGL